MLKLVPNVETFRDTLRAIKVWAKRECVREMPILPRC